MIKLDENVVGKRIRTLDGDPYWYAREGCPGHEESEGGLLGTVLGYRHSASGPTAIVRVALDLVADCKDYDWSYYAKNLEGYNGD